MKYLIFAGLLLSTAAFARDVYVQPHVRNDGTYVQGHYRTAPDNSTYNNYGAQGNSNPYTGQQGYTPPNPQQYYQPNPYQPGPTNRGNSSVDIYGNRR